MERDFRQPVRFRTSRRSDRVPSEALPAAALVTGAGNREVTSSSRLRAPECSMRTLGIEIVKFMTRPYGLMTMAVPMTVYDVFEDPCGVMLEDRGSRPLQVCSKSAGFCAGVRRVRAARRRRHDPHGDRRSVCEAHGPLKPPRGLDRCFIPSLQRIRPATAANLRSPSHGCDVAKNKASHSVRQIADVIARRLGADVALVTLSVKIARAAMKGRSGPPGPRSRRGHGARAPAAKS